MSGGRIAGRHNGAGWCSSLFGKMTLLQMPPKRVQW